ncbi:hypothetical protein Tco_1488747, partial [Tanacetum coccineum]
IPRSLAIANVGSLSHSISVGKYELEGQSTDKSEGQSTAKLKIKVLHVQY